MQAPVELMQPPVEHVQAPVEHMHARVHGMQAPVVHKPIAGRTRRQSDAHIHAGVENIPQACGRTRRYLSGSGAKDDILAVLGGAGPY